MGPLHFTLAWHDPDGMFMGVLDAARHAVDETVRTWGEDCVNQSGAVEHNCKVPGVGMVFVVVSSQPGTGEFVVHATRSRQTMMEIFDEFRAEIES